MARQRDRLRFRDLDLVFDLWGTALSDRERWENELFRCKVISCCFELDECGLALSGKLGIIARSLSSTGVVFLQPNKFFNMDLGVLGVGGRLIELLASYMALSGI